MNTHVFCFRGGLRHRAVVRASILLVVLLLGCAVPMQAQQSSTDDDSGGPSSSDAPAAATASESVQTGTQGDRIFGILPNYTTVEGAKRFQPITTKQAFKMAARDAFDPFVYPLFGFIAAVNHV